MSGLEKMNCKTQYNTLTKTKFSKEKKKLNQGWFKTKEARISFNLTFVENASGNLILSSHSTYDTIFSSTININFKTSSHI